MSTVNDDFKSEGTTTSPPVDAAAVSDAQILVEGEVAGNASAEASVQKLQLNISDIMRDADGLAYPETTVAGTLD